LYKIHSLAGDFDRKFETLNNKTERPDRHSIYMAKGIKEVRMIRNLLLTLAVLTILVSGRTMALGLGELTLHSSLNEPLNAEIELLSVHPDEMDGIKVNLASQRDFELVGVDRLFFMTAFQFNTQINKANKPVITITTKDPVKEPFIDFVIEVNWSKGRMLREYTALVDPPAFAQETPAPVKQAETKAKSSVVRQATIPEPAPVMAEEEVLFPNIPIEIEEDEPVQASSDTYGPTKRTDTLWSIAQKVRPNSKVSIEQVMQALLKKNPDAFYNNNINDLKAGHVLRIPDMEEVTEISKREAGRLSRAQYQDWKASRASSTHISTSAPGEGALMAPDMEGATSDTGPRLKLLSPEEEAELAAKQADGDRAGSGSAMQDGGTSASSEEAASLRARVNELENQLSEMEKSLAIKDEALAGFQKEMQVRPAVTAEPPQTTESEKMAEPEATKPAPAPVAKPKPTPSPQAERGFVDDLMDSPLMLAAVIAIVLVLGAIVWMVVSKRRLSDMRMNFQESILTGGASKSAEAETDGSAGEAPKGKSGDSSFLSEFSVSGIEGIQTEVSDVDPVAEADVYLAYGGFKQAEDLLKDALNNDPARPELKVKLLEVYSLSNNADAFQALAEEFYASLGGEQSPVWDKVVEMGRILCPDNHLFAGAAEPAETDNEDFPMSFDEPDIGESETTDMSDLDMGSDLDLDMPEEEGGLDLDSNLDLESNLDLDASALDEVTDKEETADLDLIDEVASLDEALSDTNAFEQSAFGESVGGTSEIDMEDSLSFDSDTVATEDADIDFNLDDSVTEEDFTMDMEDTAAEGHAPSTMFEDSAVDGGLYTDEDEVGTKLDLAKAYIDMGDPEGAKSILEEVMEEGNETQQHEARDLMSQLQQ